MPSSKSRIRGGFSGTWKLLRQLVRRLVVGWSLERKSLLFFGLALVVPIGLAFWFVLQVVANRLVMQTTRQAARDYARAWVAWRHVETMEAESVLPGAGSATVFSNAELVTAMRKHLVDNQDYSEPEYLMLDESLEYTSLEKASRPTFEREEQLLRELERDYREQLALLEQANQEAAALLDDGNRTDVEPAMESAVASEKTLEKLRSYKRNLESLYREFGPYFPEETGDPISSRMETPPEGWFVYYHAVNFPDSCFNCHKRHQTSTAEQIPFRAVRVMIPFAQTQVASTTTLAVMIAIAMLTVAATLFVVHWVLRRLVLNPLRHLHSVSDEIGRGNTDLRAHIDTGDEFNELADSFNRMLRHMTEGQEKLEQVNQELDLRIDQLAQANFNLYEANRLKSDFLANMSHELRTPLNSIIGFSEVLSDIPSLSEKQKKYAGNIQKSGRLLLEMINDILDLAKLEAGKMQVTPSAFRLDELISAQCDLVSTLVDEKNVDLKCHFEKDLPQVFQDRTKLQQILTNLLSNAIKFTPDGGLITVSARTVSPRHFEVTVEDTGVGIPESDFEIIFEKFRQSNVMLQNDGLTREYAGTGLGLSIVKELCKLLGGEIQLASQLGTGSTFRVLLPTNFDAGELDSLLAE